MKVNGSAVRAIRKAHGRTLRDVAAAAGITWSHLARIEQGEKGATEETIHQLAQALDTDPQAISYPEQPIVQATPETVQKIAEFLSVPVSMSAP